MTRTHPLLQTAPALLAALAGGIAASLGSGRYGSAVLTGAALALGITVVAALVSARMPGTGLVLVMRRLSVGLGLRVLLATLAASIVGGGEPAVLVTLVGCLLAAMAIDIAGLAGQSKGAVSG